MGTHGQGGARHIGWGLVLIVALGWSGLSYALGASGHTPSGPSPFGDAHYEMQAWLLTPVLFIAALGFGWVSWRGLGRGELPWGEWLPGAVRVYALALGVGWVLPDIVAYGLGGFDAVAKLAPILPLTSTILALAVGTRFVRGRVSATRPRILANLLGAWVFASLVLMTVVR